MANRRHGNNMGGRPYHGGGPVNPWEGGSVPGGNQDGMNSNVLSQLSEPQAQLAIALTKLLQPQQQQVPSLLSMDTVNPLGPNNMYNDYPGRGRLNYNRDRPDFRPYNKMYGRNRDTDYNRRHKSSGKSQGQRTTAASKKNSSAKTSKPSDKDDAKTKEEKNQASETDKDKSDVEESTESSDLKEKTDAEGNTDENGEEKMDEDKKDDDSENKNDESGDKSKKDKKIKDGKFAGIPAHFLKCGICQKEMWDGASFEKHMNGRAHQQMFEKVEESYRIKANMMRESIRLMEEKNTIEMDRMKRLGKKTSFQQRSHCAMCDLDFYGNLLVHRRSNGHQKLKLFLHPRCDYCFKEFPTRMEWENHRHTPEHFRNKVEGYEKKKESQKKGEIVLDDENIDSMIDDFGEIPIDTNAITDLTDNFENLKNRIPSYSSKRSVGASLITEVSGFFCEPCGRFFLDKEKSEKHTQTLLHYETFVKILNNKIKQANEEKKRKSEETVEDDSEGNWKRRKVANEEENAEDVEMKDEKEEEEPATEADGNTLYDPADTFSDPNEAVPAKKEESQPEENSEELINELDNIIKEEDEVKAEETDVKNSPSKAKPQRSVNKAKRGRKASK